MDITDKAKRKESQVAKKEQEEEKAVEETTVQESTKEDIKEETEVKERDIRTITITLDYYQTIIPLHPIADIQTKCKYLDKNIGETSLLPITDEPNLPINESFTFKVNFNSRKDSDHLISSPVLLTVYQYAGSCDPALYEQLQLCENTKHVGSAKSFDSIVSIYEAFTGETVDRDIVEAVVTKVIPKMKKTEKKKEKKAASKTSKPAKSAKVSTKKQKHKLSEVPSVESLSVDIRPIIYGTCVIDFLPLFYGKSSFTESLLISPVEVYYDERMITHKIRPRVTVTISIDKPICFPSTVILNFTVESIFNIPSLMKPDMDYKICALLPMENSASEPTVFANPVFHTKCHKNVMKCWPGIKKLGADANTTKYKLSEDRIKNTTGIDNIESCIEESNLMISFNTLKRSFLLKDGMTAFSYQVQKYRKILIEIFIYSKEKPKAGARNSDVDIDTNREKSSTSIRSCKESKNKPTDLLKKKPQHLHLMAIVDVSSLLYPGVTKIRVASPLVTFNFYEALKETGTVDSYFAPKPEQDVVEETVVESDTLKNGKKSEKAKKKEKSSASKTSKSSKKGSRRTSTAKSELKELLPPPPEAVPEPEPSTPVYNESGKPTFIVTEIELSEPIFKKRSVEDLNEALQNLLEDKKQPSSKIVLTHHVSKDYYREVLNQITKDMYDKYRQYMCLKDKKEGSTVPERDFINYLENLGAYQTYLTSIKEAIAILATTKFHISEEDKKKPHLYHNYIGEMFVYLVSEMNDTLNRLVCSGLEPVVTPKPKPLEKLYFYAKEAAALGKTDLADRYFLEIICYDLQNPNGWFYYAVFNLELKQYDKAYECVLVALEKQPKHRYSLLLLGIMLANKGQKNEAETCFLNLLVYEPRWIEGWVSLFLFYKRIEKYEGMDMAMDMIQKYIDDERTTTDLFNETEDLHWTSKFCPKTTFFRTAVLLLKMRAYEWVEMALVQEVQQYFGITHYLLSAVCLYQELYEQALEHIQHTKAYCGPNYAITTLSGHCLYALNRQVEAQEDYYHVLESLDRPNDIHMVYINCAQILDNSGNRQDARKIILLGCKYSPTHYTWYRAGLLYFQENDLLSAEECFSEANFKDNRCAVYWGYLTIINLRLNRMNEAELCYSQALKNDLDDEMCEEIRKEFKKCNSMKV